MPGDAQLPGLVGHMQVDLVGIPPRIGWLIYFLQDS